MDTFGWEARHADGRVFTSDEHRSVRNIPAGDGIVEVLVWVKGYRRDAFPIPIADGESFDVVTRRQGSNDRVSHEWLGVVRRKDGAETWAWLFEDGTVAEADHDPIDHPWGWEDFVEGVAAANAAGGTS